MSSEYRLPNHTSHSNGTKFLRSAENAWHIFVTGSCDFAVAIFIGLAIAIILAVSIANTIPIEIAGPYAISVTDPDALALHFAFAVTLSFIYGYSNCIASHDPFDDVNANVNTD